jgi:hypothetical protein
MQIYKTYIQIFSHLYNKNLTQFVDYQYTYQKSADPIYGADQSGTGTMA